MDSLIGSPTTADVLADASTVTSEEKKPIDGALVSRHWGGVDPNNPDDSAGGSFKFGKYHAHLDTVVRDDKKPGKYDIGIKGELTEVQVTQEVIRGPAKVKLTGSVNTVNGELKLGLQTDLKDKTLVVKGAAGAEAMVLDGKAEATLKITPKTVIDEIAETYNERIDPIVDFLAGTDVPGMPEAPDYLDKGVKVSVQVEGGLGASLKYSGSAGTKGGKPFAEAKVKGGLGLVGGFGGKVEATW